MLILMLMCTSERFELDPFGYGRVMAVAYGKTAESLVFCGLVGIMDPPRPSAIEFVKTMHVRDFKENSKPFTLHKGCL